MMLFNVTISENPTTKMYTCVFDVNRRLLGFLIIKKKKKSQIQSRNSQVIFHTETAVDRRRISFRRYGYRWSHGIININAIGI